MRRQERICHYSLSRDSLIEGDRKGEGKARGRERESQAHSLRRVRARL